MTKEPGPCAVCAAPAAQRCAGCQTVHYCSREHQRAHWRRHRARCVPARVRDHPGRGRGLQATRRVQPGEVVMREAPLVLGPAQITPPVCLGCNTLLSAAAAAPCARCGWPLCRADCGARHGPECHYTAAAGRKINITTFGEPHPSYQSVLVLRCLYTRDHDPDTWSKLQNLESHCARRRGTPRWDEDKKIVVEFIRNYLKLKDVFSEEEILRVCGIIQINGHEVPLSEPEAVALFARGSLLQHDCRANCYKSFSMEGHLLICAGTGVEAGAPLSVCYTDPLWGSAARRRHLADVWHFECDCARCRDVTELGSRFSAVRCRGKACSGTLLPPSFMTPVLETPEGHSETDEGQPETAERMWSCNSCRDQVRDDVIQRMLQDIGRELAALPRGDAQAAERFINHCSAYLPATHYYMVDVGLALAHLLGQGSEPPGLGQGSEPPGLGLAALDSEQLALKTQLCSRITELLETLAPAEARNRGGLLFELHAAIAETGRRAAETDGPLAMLAHIAESRKALVRCMFLLQHEPAALPEGRVLRQARDNLRQLDALAARLSAALPAPM